MTIFGKVVFRKISAIIYYPEDCELESNPVDCSKHVLTLPTHSLIHEYRSMFVVLPWTTFLEANKSLVDDLTSLNGDPKRESLCVKSFPNKTGKKKSYKNKRFTNLLYIFLQGR